MPVRKPTKRATKVLKTLNVSSRPATTVEQRDDISTIYGVQGIADLSREVLRRLTPPPDDET